MMNPFTHFYIQQCDVLNEAGEVIYVVPLPTTTKLESLLIKGELYVKRFDNRTPITFIRKSSEKSKAA